MPDLSHLSPLPDPRGVPDLPAVCVLVLLGSLRRGSANRRLAHALAAAAPPGVLATVHPTLGDLAHYDQDIDLPEVRPAPVEALLAAVRGADALIAVTPEYNGTTSSALKNAVDWASRPARRSPLSGKPVAVIGAAFGQHGGVWAQTELRRAFEIAGARVLTEPVIAIGGAGARFAELAPEADPELGTQLAALYDAVRRAVAAGEGSAN
ncbi:MAG TPA: NAD(P)H-dependent oxidoreductase [Cellulomonas sp.]